MFHGFNILRFFRLVVSLRREDIAGTSSPMKDVCAIVKVSALLNEFGKQPCLNKTCKIIRQLLSLNLKINPYKANKFLNGIS
jgi:hypothetical protein